MLKYVLLGFLNYRPLAGYDLKRAIDRSTAHFWNADLSQIYKTLKSLEAAGLIVSEVQPQDDRPDRRVYSATDAGRAALQSWLAALPLETSPLKEVMLLKLFFSADANTSDVLAGLRLQRQLHAQKLAHYQQQTPADIEANAALMGATSRDAFYWDMTRRAGELYEAMVLQWIDETIARIEQR